MSQEKLKLSPCLVLAHELYDALPVHQFEFSGDTHQWHERVVSVNQNTQELEFGIQKEPNTENVIKVLKPDKLFTKEMLSEIKPGDTIEIC